MLSLRPAQTPLVPVSEQIKATETAGISGDTRLKAPDAPVQTSRARNHPVGQHPSQFGAMVGRMSKCVVGATLGATLLLSGCASLGPAMPTGPAAGVLEVSQHVQQFAPAADGQNWVLAREPSHQVPPEMAKILDLVARARSTDDGKMALILDAETGSRVHTSPWNHSELRNLVGSLEKYADSGHFAKVNTKTAQAFFDEIIPVFSEIGPAAHAGMGLDASALNRVEQHLLTLEKQHLEAKGQG